ncbi:MAG: M15 family metallopeptidase [Lachnospiraceae bacterium]|nr:M15 family metallopeptidase [Lachnospiraceae bacterium]
MAESDKKRRAKARRRLAQKRKQKQRVAVIFLVIIAILIVILFMMERNKNGKNTGTKQNAGPETQNSDVTMSVDTSEPSEQAESVKMLNLTAEQMHSGDLVLVNGSYAYDFEANASTISLANIHDTQSFSYPVGKEDFQVAGRIMPYLDQLVDACDSAVGSKMTGVASAYRSMEYQQSVWDEMSELYGEEYARSYVAVPGYSEHHTGLSVDMSIYYEDGSEGTFSESENAVWMNENSYHYGFVRRYAEDKVEVTGISNEAWHFRYVGIPHATYMATNNLCLEEYIDYLRANARSDNPLTIICDSGTYEVFFTTETTLEEPDGEYTISGNNVDGYIITVKTA